MTMSTTHQFILALTVLCEFIYSHKFTGNVCTLQSTKLPGVCKLLSDCQQVREELRKHNRTTQPCGRSKSVVCCPKAANRHPQRKPGKISKRKCKEYAKYAFETKRSPVLLFNAPSVTRNECGHTVVKLIVGGEPAGSKEFPHMAAIGFGPTRDKIQWLCGGTILNKKYILTAAHCLSDYSYGDAQWVRLGVTDLMNSSHVQDIKIAKRIPYPQYRLSSHYHDIGLIKLKKAATFNPYARPACLYLEPEVSTEKAIATGWGKTSWAGQGTNNLLKVSLDLFGHDDCNDSYKNQISRKLRHGIVNDIQMCAGSVDEEKDTCQGDSGGPLQIYHIGDDVKCMYDIIGITSFGKACSGSPGVYTRVSHYVKWIEDHVWP